jgi:DNA-binding Xre family transcriptional regulator
MDIEGRKQSFIARSCGFEPKDFSAMLTGYRPIRIGDIEKICEGLEVKPNVIFGYDDPAPATEEIA